METTPLITSNSALEKAELRPRISEASTADVENIVDLWNKVAMDNVVRKDKEQLSEDGFFLRVVNSEAVHKILETPRSIILVDKKNDRIDAFTVSLSMKEWMKLNPKYKEGLTLNHGEENLLEQEDNLFIYAVMAGAETSHVATSMYRELFKTALEKGYKVATGQIVLDPIPNNRSLRFHSIFNFEQVGTRKDRKSDVDVTWGFFKKQL